MDLVISFALGLIAFGGIGLIILFVYRKAKGESFWTPWISKMERGEPSVAVIIARYNVENVVDIAAKYGYEMVSAQAMSGGVNVGYVYDSYIFLPPEREVEYMLVFRKIKNVGLTYNQKR